MEIGKCATCKHWRKPENEFGEIPGIGKCLAAVQYWDVTEWAEDSNKRVLRKEYANKLAFVRDRSNYFSELTTLPGFGCVQHEKI